MYHNCQSCNVQRLMLHVIRALGRVKKDGDALCAGNMLCLLRVVLQDLMEHLTPAQLQTFVDLPYPEGTPAGWRWEGGKEGEGGSLEAP